MARTTLTLLVLAGLSFGLIGCDSQASQQAEAQRHLDAAVAKLRQANTGYIAQADENNPVTGGLLVYRQDQMEAAFEDLNKVMSLDAPVQKVQAQRLGAEIDASAARHAAREAHVENAALNGRSTVLLSYLSAMEGSSARSAELQPQTEEQLAKLQEEIQTQSTRQEELSATVTELQAQLATTQAQVDSFRNRANDIYAQAQSLYEEAFVATGDRMYDLQDQAADLERKAAIESASAEERQVLVDDLNARLTLNSVQLDTVNKLLGELTGQVDSTRSDTARLTDASGAAAEASKQAAQTLADEYAQLAEVYAEAVEKRMNLAGERADKAVDALLSASSSQVAASDMESLKLQLLSAHIDQAHIASSHAIYAGIQANTTRAVLNSVNQASPEGAGLYTDRLNELTDMQIKKMRDKATAAIEAGLALAEELAPEGTTPDEGDTQASALLQKSLLIKYDERLATISQGS